MWLHALTQRPQPLPPHTNANLTTEVYPAAKGAWHSLSFARCQLSFRMLSGRELIPDHTREKGHCYEGEKGMFGMISNLEGEKLV